MEFVQNILHNDLAVLFLILTFGCMLGRIKILGMELSSSGGVLFVALAFGHFKYILPENVGTFGFAFFIYAIGFEAGPRFFQTFKKNGLKFGLAAIYVVIIATSVAVLCAKFFSLKWVLLPGILAGALTSTATLASAYELVKDPLISVSYGITYPFGLIGLLIMVQYLPKILKINLIKEAQLKYGFESKDNEKECLKRRIFCVKKPEIVGITLKELNLRKLRGIGIVTIKHDNKIELANANTTLCFNDHVLAEGQLINLLEMEEYIGPEIIDESFDVDKYETMQIIINSKHIVNHSISELELVQNLGIVMTHVKHSDIEQLITPDTILMNGDVVTAVGPEKNLKKAISILGHQENQLFETDIFTFSAGLIAGLILGMIKLPIINISIGSAGGLLFMGILLGYMRNFGPFAGRVPLAARFILQELGLLLFLATVGTAAGKGLVEQLFTTGPQIFISGVLVTTITLIATLFFCHKILKFDWNTSFGATTGGITSTVALKIVNREAKSQYATLGYAGVYAFANILLTMLGQLIFLLE